MPNLDSEIKLDFKDVLLLPKRSTLKSRSDVNLSRTFTFKHSKRTFTGVPIMASNMDTVGTFEIAKVLAESECFTCIHKYYSIDEWKVFASENPGILKYVAVSSGMSDSDFESLTALLTLFPEISFICLDVANGYSESFLHFVSKTRKAFPTHTIIAGNVVTGEMVEALLLEGADIVKVGIGPGSVCTTRKKTGVGYPQLSALLKTGDSAHGLGGHIISDGGVTCPGDVAKAFGAGADFVMIGGLFAGHEQSGGDVIVNEDGVKVKVFYGMSSRTAMNKHRGGVAEYRASEGKTVSVPYRGDLRGTIGDILGGLRSACTYVGASVLKEMSRRATFIRVTQQMNGIFGDDDS